MNAGANVGANFSTMSASNAAVAATIEATRASGVIVQIEPEDFRTIVEQNEEPIVVHTLAGLFTKTHRYLTSYRGLAFHTKSPMELSLPPHYQLVAAKSIWIPGCDLCDWDANKAGTLIGADLR